jgi:hypothetical protein
VRLRIALILLIGIVALALLLRTVFLLVSRKPVLGHVIGSTFPDWSRLSHRGWQLAIIGDALSGDANEPTEKGSIQVRYTVDGRDYCKEFRTTVRKGERPEPTVMLWYDPRDPCRAPTRGSAGSAF